jgi:PAS domain S-box-containing protein
LTRQRTTEQSLRESEERLRLATDAAQLGVFEWNVQNDIPVWHNARMFEIFGLSPQDRPLDCEQLEHEVIHPDDLFRFQREVLESMQNRTPFTGKYRIRRFNDGQWRWIEYLGTFEYAENGDVIRLLSVLSDITERKQAEEALKESEAMYRSIGESIDYGAWACAPDGRIREELNDVRDRVRSMGLVHEKLYQTSDLDKLDFAEYAASLTQALLRSHSTLAQNVRLKLAVEPVSLSIETAVPCGLILNELVGNALKHAFPNNGCGEVEVGLEIDPATKVVCLRIRDNSVGLPADFDWHQSKSLGLRLVKILSGQMRGTVETETGPGTEFKIIFSLKDNEKYLHFDC